MAVLCSLGLSGFWVLSQAELKVEGAQLPVKAVFLSSWGAPKGLWAEILLLQACVFYTPGFLKPLPKILVP